MYAAKTKIFQVQTKISTVWPVFQDFPDLSVSYDYGLIEDLFKKISNNFEFRISKWHVPNKIVSLKYLWIQKILKHLALFKYTASSAVALKFKI